MKKKLIFSLGAVASLSAPVIAVVSCGSVQIKEETIRDLNLLKSSQGLALIVNEWQEEFIENVILKDNSNSFASLEEAQISAAKRIIENELYKSDKNNYLIEIANKIAQSGKYPNDGQPGSYAWLKEKGLYKNYNGRFIDMSKDIDNETIKFLLDTPVLDIDAKVNKLIIGQYYLTKVTKDLYLKAFNKRTFNLKSRENSYNEDQFRITKQAMDKRLFAKWTVELTEIKSANFVGFAPLASDKVLEHIDINNIQDSTKVVNQANYSDTQNRYSNFYNKLINNAKISNYIGYTGISTLSAMGSEKLSFNDSTNELIDGTTTDWTGFIQDNDLVDKDIKLAEEPTGTNGKQVKINYVHGFMPIYKAGEYKMVEDMQGTNFEKLKQLAELFVLEDSGDSIYQEAQKYFTTDIDENNKAYLLDFDQEANPDLYRIYTQESITRNLFIARDPKDN